MTIEKRDEGVRNDHGDRSTAFTLKRDGDFDRFVKWDHLHEAQ